MVKWHSKIFNELGLLESIPDISFSFISKLVGPFINLVNCALQHEPYYSSQGLPLRFEVESLGCSHGQLGYKFDGLEFLFNDYSFASPTV